MYRQALSLFESFRARYGLAATWPVPVNVLESFLSYMRFKCYAHRTASTYLSAIRFKHRALGFVDNAADVITNKMLEGYRRLNPVVDSRRPITYELLCDICANLQYVCSSQFEATLFRAAYCLAFFGLFRVGELVFSSHSLLDAPLKVSDVQFDKASFQVQLRRSKTNQHGAPQFVPIISTSTIACPVAAMKAYLRIRPQAGTYLFCHQDGTPLTSYQFGAVLTKVLKACNVRTAHFKSHSFRIGAATWLARQGVPFQKIQAMGRWSSNVFVKYIR